MGIETAALLGYLGTAASVASAAAGVYGAVESSKAAKKAAPAMQIQMPAEAPKAQATKNADRAGAVAANALAAMPGGSLAGNSGTFLTGPGGVDASLLNLGKNTLLGQ